MWTGALTCLKGQPTEESRSRNAWVQGAQAAAVGPPVSSGQAEHTQTWTSQPSRWSRDKESSLGTGAVGPVHSLNGRRLVLAQASQLANEQAWKGIGG